jgi:uncharacterized protein
MNLKDQLNADLKDALKSGDETRKLTLRSLLAAIKQAEIDGRTTLDEAGIHAILQKEAKSRRESIADAQKAERADLVTAGEAELKLIEAYLPQMLTREELETLARAAIAEAGATDLKQLGAVMKLLTLHTKGRADGKLVNEIVREILSERQLPGEG